MTAYRSITEDGEGTTIPRLVQSEWRERFPWVLQGTTSARSADDRLLDFRLFGDAPAGDVVRRWSALLEETGFVQAIHSRQVHGRAVLVHGGGGAGLQVAPDCDGHVSRAPGVLMAISLADCVPVFVVDPERRAAAVLHAGWRGAAAGILERGLEVLQERLGSDPDVVHVHLGPSICGRCYEVGPEVHVALGRREPSAPEPLDLREALAERCEGAGVAAERITVSTLCTLCGDAPLFSHRGGDGARHLGILGVRPGGPQ